MEFIKGIVIHAYVDSTGFDGLCDWFAESGMKVKKAVDLEHSNKTYSADNKPFVSNENALGSKVNIKPTHIVTAHVFRHPKSNSGTTRFLVEVEKRKTAKNSRKKGESKKVVKKTAGKPARKRS